MQNQLRLSLHAVDMLIPASSSTSNTSEWVVQTTEDGSEQYYYNPNTQEMRYSMPPEGVMEEKIKQALASNNSQGSIHESYYTTALKNMDHHDSFERPPVRPERAANRIITEEFTQDFRSNSPMRAASTIPQQQSRQHNHHHQQQQLEEEYEDDDKVIRYFYIKLICLSHLTFFFSFL